MTKLLVPRSLSAQWLVAALGSNLVDGGKYCLPGCGGKGTKMPGSRAGIPMIGAGGLWEK